MIFCNLREILRNNNITATTLATKTQISRNTINQLVNNKTNGIQFETLEKICAYLNIAPSDLLIYSPYNFSFSISDLNIKSDHFVGTGNLVIDIYDTIGIDDDQPIKVQAKQELKCKFLTTGIVTYPPQKECSQIGIMYDFLNVSDDIYLMLQKHFAEYSPKVATVIANIIEDALLENEEIIDFLGKYTHVKMLPCETLTPIFNSNTPIKPTSFIDALSVILSRDKK